MKKKYNEDCYGIVERKCPICGKVFIPAPLHAYKRAHGGRMKWLCSYHCLLEWDKKHPRRYVCAE